MEKKRLILELNEKMRIAKINAHWKEEKDTFDKKQVFVGSATRLNPRFISNKQYFQIAEFYNFLKENEDLTDEEIREVLKSKFIDYKFLRKLDKLIPGFFEELKFHGPMCVAIQYVDLKVRKENNKEFNKLLNRMDSYK